jgi:hypothetical protein
MISVVILTQNEEADLPDLPVGLMTFTFLIQAVRIKSLILFSNEAYSWRLILFKVLANNATTLWIIWLSDEWILFLNANEIVTEQFRHALLKATNEEPDDVAGFYCCWKMRLKDKWQRYDDKFPKCQIRMMRKNRVWL